MRNVVLGVFLLSVISIVGGCGYNPKKNADPVQVKGVVLLPTGQPAAKVGINFLPTTSTQNQGSATLGPDGKFTATLTPGKYTYMFEGGNVQPIPAKYHKNDAANTIDVPSSGSENLEIKLSN